MIPQVPLARRASGALLLALPAASFAQMPMAQAPETLAAGSENGAATPVPDGNLIVVTAGVVPVELRKVGASFTVIDGETIERRNFAYFADVLRTVPGVAVSRSGSFGAPVQVRLRGAEGNHTLVLIDGIEVSSIGVGEFDFSSLLAANIDRVEVLRGPQSGLYGSNALGGVINVITKGGDGPLFDAAAEAGSYASLMSRGALTLGDRETFLSASAIVRSTDGFSTAVIGSEADGDRNITTYLRGGAAFGPAMRLDASLRFVDKNTEADGFDFSGGPNQGLAIDDDSFQDTQELSAGLALSILPAANVSARLTGAYNDYELVTGNAEVASFGNRGDRVKLGGYVAFSLATSAAARHTLTPFIDYERESYRNTFPSDPSQIAEQNRDILGVGAEYRLDLGDRVFLKAALRHDDNSRFADATTYGLTGSFLLNTSGTRLHASYGKGVSNPTFFEQFGFTPGQFVGNPDLVPEHARGFDIGLEHRWDERVLVDLTYFSSTLKDEIIDAFPSVANQTGESEREGVEFTARAELGSWHLGGTYTFLDASDPDGTREVRRPRHHASFNAGLDFGPEKRSNLNLSVLYDGERLDTDFRDFFTNGFQSEKSALDDYFLVRLAGSFRLSERFTLFGRVENLLDEDYQEVISYGTAGLSAYGGVRVTLR